MPRDLGMPQIPGSKSHAQRAMCLAAFLPGRWTLRGAPANDDVAVLAAALAQMGAAVEQRPGRLVFDGRPGPDLARLDLGANGTAMRFLSVVLPMLGYSAELCGTEGLQARPMDAALDFLSRYDAAVEEGWPLRVGGDMVKWPEELHVNAEITSQVASGVLLGGVAYCLLINQQILYLRSYATCKCHK